MELTSITTKFAVSLYKSYLERIKSDVPRSVAAEFNNPSHSDFSDFSDDNIDYCLKELKNHKYIKEDILGNITLQPVFICDMENRFKSDLTKVLKFLADLASNII